MPKPIIEVSNLSKLYHLGQIGHTSFRDLAERWTSRLCRRSNKIGTSDDKSAKHMFSPQQEGPEPDSFWALKDVSFTVQPGEVVGIIGRNGAGKSTLLKILSRITEPTSGEIKLRGRVASLLEVGTGFHPELTGRENIYLNGAILGMTRAEIRKKFDEIVAFAEVENFIDTPVKRYSSGMYVRLAFAVAAHLEPEILVVDEVLAVGDAQFQKKCLGKMKTVANEGRTVLFVSHNMQTVQSICSKGLYLKNGSISAYGEIESIIQQYLHQELFQRTYIEWEDKKPGDDVAVLNYARLIDQDYQTAKYIKIGERVGVEFGYTVKREGFFPVPNIHFYTNKDIYVFVANEPKKEAQKYIGIHQVRAWIPADLLNSESYKINIALSTLSPVIIHFNAVDALVFDVNEDINKRENDYKQCIPGVVRPKLQWESTLLQPT